MRSAGVDPNLMMAIALTDAAAHLNVTVVCSVNDIDMIAHPGEDGTKVAKDYEREVKLSRYPSDF